MHLLGAEQVLKVCPSLMKVLKFAEEGNDTQDFLRSRTFETRGFRLEPTGKGLPLVSQGFSTRIGEFVQ